MPSKCKSVDLPAPEGPMMETNSPSLILALMRRRTKVLVGPCSKYFSTFRRTISGELIDTLILLLFGYPAPLFFPWRPHSCVPRRDSSRRSLVIYSISEGGVETSLDAARRVRAPRYSYRNAITGSTVAARRAGT